MKKLLSLLLSAVMITSLSACGEESSYPEENLPTDPITDSSPAPEMPEGEELKLGIGIVATNEGSTPADENNPGKFKNTTIFCAVAVDSEGYIRDVKFDSVNLELPFDNKGVFTDDITLPVRSYREMGFDVGMAETSPLKREWFQQMDSFQNFIMGKKVVDILNMELDENYIPTADELKGMIDISVSDQLVALNKAYNNAV